MSRLQAILLFHLFENFQLVQSFRFHKNVTKISFVIDIAYILWLINVNLALSFVSLGP